MRSTQNLPSKAPSWRKMFYLLPDWSKLLWKPSQATPVYKAACLSSCRIFLALFPTAVFTGPYSTDPIFSNCILYFSHRSQELSTVALNVNKDNDHSS